MNYWLIYVVGSVEVVPMAISSDSDDKSNANPLDLTRSLRDHYFGTETGNVPAAIEQNVGGYSAIEANRGHPPITMVIGRPVGTMENVAHTGTDFCVCGHGVAPRTDNRLRSGGVNVMIRSRTEFSLSVLDHGQESANPFVFANAGNEARIATYVRPLVGGDENQTPIRESHLPSIPESRKDDTEDDKSSEVEVCDCIDSDEDDKNDEGDASLQGGLPVKRTALGLLAKDQEVLHLNNNDVENGTQHITNATIMVDVIEKQR